MSGYQSKNFDNLMPIEDDPNFNKEKNDTLLTPLFLRLGWCGSFFILSMYVLPFFFGGRGGLVQGVIKIVLFCVVFLSYAYPIYLTFKDSESYVLSKLSLRYFLPFVPLLLVFLFQVIPIPLAFLDYLSPEVSLSYKKAGADSGFLTINRNETLSAFSWFFIMAMCLNVCLQLPYVVMKVGNSLRNSKKKAVLFAPKAREYDFLSEVFQKTLIRVSLFCSVIALSHLAFKSNKLFGIFELFPDYQPSFRAHWPFANANQLAVMLEIGLVLSFSRFLRSRYLKLLTMSSVPKQESIGHYLLHIMHSLERHGKDLLVIFILSLGLILTMSRAGIALTCVALSFLWVYYLINPVQLIMNTAKREDIRKIGFFKTKIFLSIGLPFLCMVGVLSFLGGDVAYNLSNRVSETYDQVGSAPRWELNYVTSRIFYDNLLFGVGLNCWKYFAPAYATDYLAGWKLDYAHNDIFQFISEIGIVGLISSFVSILYFALLLGKVFRISLSSVQKFNIISLCTAFLVPIVHSFFDFPFHLPILSFSIFLVMVSLLRAVIFQLDQGQA